MTVISIGTAFVTAVIIILFVPYTWEVWHLPAGHRPLTPEFDRLGRPIGLEENPDYTETQPTEEHRNEREA